MAAAADETYVSKIECRYFRLGICSKGKDCRYSHSFNPEKELVPLLHPVDAAPEVSGVHKQHPQYVNSPSLKHNYIATGETAIEGSLLTIQPDVWVKASEFVPGQPWSGLATSSADSSAVSIGSSNWFPESEFYDESCGYAVGGSDSGCVGYGVDGADPVEELGYYASTGCMDNCPYSVDEVASCQPDFCDMCGQQLPPPSEEEHRNQHLQECIHHHEEEMELSFAVQRSQDKTCGVCMEVIWEKEPESAARFGILSNCSHVFCLSCIRRWRAAEQFDKKTIRGCPECRVQSDFVVPSRYWFDDQEGKNRLIAVYKAELSKKHCRHFARGDGKCPFNEKCFYLHAYPDGRIASPRPVRRRGDGCLRRREQTRAVGDNESEDTDSDSDTDGFVEIQPSTLYEIIEELNERVARLADQLENSILRRLNLPRTGLLFMGESDDESFE